MIKSTPRIFGIFAAFLALASQPVPAPADPVSIISVQSGHSVVLNADGLSRVAVGDGRIAGVVPVGSSQIVVNGKNPGHTTVLVWANGQREVYEVTVTEQSIDDIARVLRTAIDMPDVQVLSFGSNLVVRGSVSDQAAFARLQDLLGRFSGMKIDGHEVKLVNAVTVSHPLGPLQQEMARIPGANDVRLEPDGQGNVIVSGRVRDRASAERIVERARGLAGAYLAADGKVIDRLTTETSTQVDVKVYIVEVDKSISNNLGLQLQGGQFQQIYFPNNAIPPGSSSNITFGAPSFVGVENPGCTALQVCAFTRSTMLAPTLNLLIQNGHGRILASPDLVTLPGQEASFLVGGEIPVPYNAGLGAISIMWKEYGVKLDVTPTVLGNGSIDTKINPEVSELDFQDGTQINGFTIPAMKTSKVSTEVITQTGEAIVLGGLVHRVESRTLAKWPILGDIPILGNLFRSTNYQRNDTDVVFVMEPTILTR